jgi:hypothetical protein
MIMTNRLRDEYQRQQIEAWRERNLRVNGLRDTREIDRELAGMPLSEQFKAWKELAP